MKCLRSPAEPLSESRPGPNPFPVADSDSVGAAFLQAAQARVLAYPLDRRQSPLFPENALDRLIAHTF